MKINELKISLAKITECLAFKFEEIKQPNNRIITAKFTNLINFRIGINMLEETSLLMDEINEIKKSGIFSTTQDELVLNLQEAKKLKVPMLNLVKLVKALNRTFSELAGIERENSVSIKLPEITDFKDLSIISNKFHTIFSQAIINDEIKGQIKIDNVENGSIWFDVYLGSLSALTLVGGITWSAAVVYKKIQEGRIIEEHVKSLKIKNDSLQEIQEAQKKALDLMIDEEAIQLYSDNFNAKDNNEQIERLKHSISLLSDLIDKGAEIHPALNAPEKVANLFPNIKNLELVESKIKKLKE